MRRSFTQKVFLSVVCIGGLLSLFLLAKNFSNFKLLLSPVVQAVGAQVSEQSLSPESLKSKINSATTISKPFAKVQGLTMFRGNPTRTWYGEGPLPLTPTIAWKYPDSPMCSLSEVFGVTKQWCGNGWTGQPVVWEHENGSTEIIFGAYDRKVHFVDSQTGKDVRPSFLTGDLIKGSVTLDPDGYPLLYFGSRDNKLRIVALDQDIPTELWALDADAVKGKWNNDWDGNPLVMDGLLFEGGENGWFFIYELNRSYVDGKVAVAPKLLFETPAYNDALIARVGNEVSIENSVVRYGDRVYFANSGGRIVGFDVSKAREGEVPLVFDYWVGDDTDATIVADGDGMLYVSSEEERMNETSQLLGQLTKLNPYNKTNPYIWGIHVPLDASGKGGIWATPALSGDYLYVPTHTGVLLAVNKDSGEVTWFDSIGTHAWSSPVVINDTLLVATCEVGSLRQYGLKNPAKPELLHRMLLPSGACIEATPAVWKGNIYVGSRDGYFYKFTDAHE